MLSTETKTPGGTSEVALSLNSSGGFGGFFESLKSKFQPGPAPESRQTDQAVEAASETASETAGAAAKNVKGGSDVSGAADTAAETVKSIVGAAPTGKTTHPSTRLPAF